MKTRRIAQIYKLISFTFIFKILCTTLFAKDVNFYPNWTFFIVVGSKMAIDEHGSLWAWGENRYGQLGDGTRQYKNFPIQIKVGTQFKVVKPLGTHTMAIDESGNLWA
jgi:alpha-tubulin suppressor-like RCC1 family protein